MIYNEPMDEKEIEQSETPEPTESHETQTQDSGAEGSEASVVEESTPRKSSPMATALALVFFIGAVGFLAWNLYFKDYDPVSGKAQAMMGKKAADLIAAVGKPDDDVIVSDFLKKYPTPDYTPETPTAGEKNILVYKRGKWTIFVFIGHDDEVIWVHKAEYRPFGPGEDMEGSLSPGLRVVRAA